MTALLQLIHKYEIIYLNLLFPSYYKTSSNVFKCIEILEIDSTKVVQSLG